MSKKTTTKKTAAETKNKSGTELGRTGTNIFSGMINEEYLGELSGTRAMKVYDEMRKSDATVKAALLAIQLPIRRAQWFITPGTDDDQGKEIAEFVDKALFQYQSITWDDILRQALLSTAYGVMVFEKVFEIKTIGSKQVVCWKKFAPRLPKSIIAWQMENGDDGIQQQTIDGSNVSIPIEKLLIFVQEKEGDNWWGISALRAAYKAWYMKKNLEVIDAIAHERQGLGVPFVKLPPSASDQDKTQATTILSNMRAHDGGYLLEPDNMSVEFKDMHSGTTKDAARAIDYHDRQIVKAVLAQFLSLGSGPSGSYGLSQDHSTLFLQSIEAIANNICDVINKYAIEQLVNLNFDGVQEYPKLEYSGISRKDVEGLSTAYQRLMQSGGLKKNDADDGYLRKVLGLPDNETAPTETEDETVEETTADLGLSEATKKKVENAEIETALSKRLSEIKDQAKRMDFMEGKIKILQKFSSKYPTLLPVERALSAHYAELKRKVFQEENNFKGWRKLTFAEKKVNLAGLQDYINKKEAGFIDDTGAILKEATEVYLDKLTKAVNSNDRQTVKDLEMPYWNDYKMAIKKYIWHAFDFGKNNASREIGEKSPSSPNDFAQTIDLMAETIATNHYYEVENEAKLAIANELSKFGEKEIKALAKAAAAIAGSSDSLLANTAAIVVSAAINQGRALVFDKYKSKIHALQRSEILDEVTCNFCLSIDGRIVDVDDPIAKGGPFHSNCRGIWVEILKDEEELPPVTGVPNSIRDRIGDSVNELVQPKKPIVKKDSLAQKAIDKGKAGEKEASELMSNDPKQCEGCGSGHRLIHTSKV